MPGGFGRVRFIVRGPIGGAADESIQIREFDAAQISLDIAAAIGADAAVQDQNWLQAIQPAGGTTYNDSISESIATADTVTGLISTATMAVSETAATADTVSATIVTATMAISESAATSETVTGTIVTATMSVGESVATADTVSGALVMPGSLSESIATSDTVSAVLVAVGSISETAAAADTVTATLDAVGSIAETAAATDTVTGTIVTATMAVAESAAITDTVTGGSLYNDSVSESIATADTVSATLVAVGAVSETAAVTDTVSATLVAVGAIAETVSTADAVTGLLVTVTMPVSESVGVADTTDGAVGGQVYNESISESVSITDTVDAPDTGSGIDTHDGPDIREAARKYRKKIEDELAEVQALIETLRALLKSEKKMWDVIKKEIAEIIEKYGDDRRTRIMKKGATTLSAEDLVPDEESVLVLTSGGYIKRTNPGEYKKQKRGGVGVVDLDTKDEDFVTHFVTASAHCDILFFSDRGRAYQLKMYELPEGKRETKGKSIMNFLSLEAGENITSILPMPKEAKAAAELSLLLATKGGTVKKTAAAAFKEVRRSGLLAITLDSGDALISAQFVRKGDDVMLVTAEGQSIRFDGDDVREMGRAAGGVRGMKLDKGDAIVGGGVIPKGTKDADLLVISSTGYGKKTKLSEYKTQGRGGSGIKTMQITAKTKQLVGAAVLLKKGAELVAMSKKSQTIRTGIDELPTLSRATQGVRVMKLYEGDSVASFVIFESEE